MKYPTLEEPCKSCLYKCFRVENPNFIADKNCKWNKKEQIKEIAGVQERIWK